MKILLSLMLFIGMAFSSQNIYIKPGVDEGSVDGEWFKQNIKMLLEKTHVLDIRKPSQREKGYLEGTTYLSISELKIDKFIEQMPKKGIVLLTCQSGTVSLDTYISLRMKKYPKLANVYYLDGYVLCNKQNNCEIHPNEPIEEGLD